MNTEFWARVRKGAASEAFANVSRLVIQIASVPLFLMFWGASRYGEWLLLTAILGYLRLGNAGFSQATRNRMAIEVSAGSRETALGQFQSTSMLFLLIGMLILGTSGIGAFFAQDIHAFLNFQQLEPADLGAALVMLGLLVLIHLQVEVLDAGFRCEGHYGLGTFLVVLADLAAFGLIILTLVSGGGLLLATACHLAGSVLRLCLLWLVLRFHVPWVRFGFRLARWRTIKSFFWPSLGFMAFPFGQAMSLQGTLLVIGSILGPQAVVIFNTLRMMSRYTVYLTVMFARIASPEIAYAFGRQDYGLMRRLHWQACRIGYWAALGACALLAITTPWILAIWTQGSVLPLPLVYGPLLAAVFFWTVHTLAANILQATNHHGRYAVHVLAAGVLTLALVLVLTRSFNLAGAAIATMLGELALVVTTLPSAARFGKGSTAAFLRHVARPPSPWMFKQLKPTAVI